MARFVLPKDPDQRSMKIRAIEAIYTEPPLSFKDVAENVDYFDSLGRRHVDVAPGTVARWMQDLDENTTRAIVDACDRARG